MVLKTFLTRIKERNFRGIAKQTERLDSQTRQHLQEFLEDVPEEQQELEELEEELFQASLKLDELKEKEEFIGTRLTSYREQLTLKDDHDDGTPAAPPLESAAAAASSESSSSHTGSHHSAAPDASDAAQQQQIKQQTHIKTLEKIELVHAQMIANMAALSEKIQKMERRKLELQWHLEECQVVLKTAEELEQQETELALEEVVVSPNTEEDATVAAEASTSSTSAAEQSTADEELGTVE